MTIESELARLAAVGASLTLSKSDIRDVLISKNVPVPVDALLETFDDYVSLLGAVEVEPLVLSPTLSAREGSTVSISAPAGATITALQGVTEITVTANTFTVPAGPEAVTVRAVVDGITDQSVLLWPVSATAAIVPGAITETDGFLSIPWTVTGCNAAAVSNVEIRADAALVSTAGAENPKESGELSAATYAIDMRAVFGDSTATAYAVADAALVVGGIPGPVGTIPGAVTFTNVRSDRVTATIGADPTGITEVRELRYTQDEIGVNPDITWVTVTGLSAGEAVDLTGLDVGVEIYAQWRMNGTDVGQWSDLASALLPLSDPTVFADTFLGTASANVSAGTPEIDVVGTGWVDIVSSNLAAQGSGTATHVGTFVAIAGTQLRGSLFPGGPYASTAGTMTTNVLINTSTNRTHLIACATDATLDDCIVATLLSSAAGGNLSIRERIAGVETVIGSTTTLGVVFNADLPASYEMTLRRNGTDLDVLINGTSVLTASSTLLPTGTLWGLGGGATDAAQYFSDVTFVDSAAITGDTGEPPVTVGDIELSATMSGTTITGTHPSQTLTFATGFSGYLSASAAVTTELGKTYRATCTVDTSTVPAGTPIQLRAMRTSDMQDDGSITFATKSLLGSDVVYADGTVQSLDLRWTDWTDDGVCYVGILAMQPFSREVGTIATRLQVPGIANADTLLVGSLAYEEFLDTGHGEAAGWTASVTTVRRLGVEMTLNQAATVKKYVNGDIAIVRNPGLEVTGFTPSGAPQYFNVDGSYNITPTGSVTTTFQKLHGVEKNAWRAGWEEAANKSVDAPNIQAFESRPEGAFSDPFYLQVGYDDTYNIDPGNTLSNIPIGEDMSLTKARHFVEPLDQPSQGRRRLAHFVHFTFVTSAPADNSFRPFPGAVSKASTHTLADCDFSVLPSLTIPGTVPDIDTFTYANALQIAKMQPSPQVRTNPTYALSVSALATGVYGRETAEEMSERFYAPCITDKLTTPQKEEIATGLVQYGLDVHYCNLLRNEAWSHGGATPPTKEAAVLASVILGDATMQGLITAGALQFDVRDNPSLSEAARRYPHVWDNLTGPVVQANIDQPRSIFIETAATNYQMRAAMTYFPENLGMPSYQDTAKPVEPWVVDGNPPGQNTWNAAYRLISKTSSLIPILAIYHTTGARTVYANETTLKWFDMMFRYLIVNNDSITSTERLRTFQKEMWQTFRSTGAPVTVGRFGLNDETTVSAAEIVTLFSDTYDAAFAAKFPTVDPPATLTEARVKGGAINGVPRLRNFTQNAAMSWALEPEWFGIAGAAGTSHLSVGTLPTSYSIISGSLPAGMSLNTTTGVISGTPTVLTTGNYREVTISATNASGSSSQVIRFAVVA